MSSTRDYDHKHRIAGVDPCYEDYNDGQGATSTITGCATYFYSDDESYWAVISPS